MIILLFCFQNLSECVCVDPGKAIIEVVMIETSFDTLEKVICYIAIEDFRKAIFLFLASFGKVVILFYRDSVCVCVFLSFSCV